MKYVVKYSLLSLHSSKSPSHFYCRRDRFPDLGPRPRSPPREAQVNVHGGTQEAGRGQVERHNIIILVAKII